MQNPIHKFGQSSIVFEKSGILLKIWKFWRASTTLQFNCFGWNLAHVSYLPISTKGCAGISLFCLDLESFAKTEKTWFLHTCFFFIINNLRSRRNKTKSVTPFYGHYQQKNIKLCGSWSSPKFSIFQTKKQVSWK